VSTGTALHAGINALKELDNGDILVGGYFNYAGGVPARNIARWDGQQWWSLGAGLDGGVGDIEQLRNGDIVVQGSFSTAGTIYARHISRWDGTSWWAMGAGPNDYVDDLAVMPNGDLLAVGSFYQIGGVYARGVARWDGQAWHPIDTGLTGSYNVMGAVCAAALEDGSMAVGGNFTVAGSRVSSFVAHLQTNCPAAVDLIPTGCVGPTGPIGLSALSLPWVGSTCRSRATGFSPTSLAVALFGMSSPGLPLSQFTSTALPGCDILADAVSISLVVPQAGVSTYDLVIPNAPALARVALFHQFLQFELDPQGGLASLSSSNGLALTVGVF
jgi:hypothetical protein